VNPFFQLLKDEKSLMVTSPGRTWKQFWDSMERMSDRLEEIDNI
jgi:hypothetical protein